MQKITILLIAFMALLFGCAKEQRSLRVLSTTSLQNSGLLDYLAPHFLADSGIQINVIALGTGQAIATAKRGDGDVLLVHDEASELRFMQEGYGDKRRRVMYNYFVIVGPKSDPANIKFAENLEEVLRVIYDAVASKKAVFLSRGDDSGTHKAEMRLWQSMGLNIATYSGEYYRETGSGMGATLNMASSDNNYTFSDYGTWLSFANKRDLTVLFSGDERLFNQYSAITLAKKHSNVKYKEANQFTQWIVSDRAQDLISKFIVEGEVLFTPNAGNENN